MHLLVVNRSFNSRIKNSFCNYLLLSNYIAMISIFETWNSNVIHNIKLAKCLFSFPISIWCDVSPPFQSLIQPSLFIHRNHSCPSQGSIILKFSTFSNIPKHFVQLFFVVIHLQSCTRFCFRISAWWVVPRFLAASLHFCAPLVAPKRTKLKKMGN